MNANQIAMTLALLAVAPLASATSTPDRTAAHEHGHHAHSAKTEPPAATQRWSVDAPLQSGIGKIRAAVERIGQTGRKAPSRGEVVQLAGEIDAEVSDLIANCTLEPQADAALHTIIARLLGATGTLRAKPDATAAAVVQLRTALADYPKYFDDPRWLPFAD